MEFFNDLIKQIANIETGALLVLVVIGTGYLLKAIPMFPNQLIPVATFIVAVAGNVLLGEVPADAVHRNPHVRLALVGVIFWAVGWLLHNQGLSRLEKFLPEPIRKLIGVESTPNNPPQP
jgi:predicted tellurium resistance membrane protein TerC